MQQTTLVIPQNTDYNQTINLNNSDGSGMNLVGFQFHSSFKTSYETPNIAGNLVFTMTDAPNGVLSFGISAANTANLVPQKYVFDILMIDTSNVHSRIMQGLLVLTPAVTGL